MKNDLIDKITIILGGLIPILCVGIATKTQNPWFLLLMIPWVILVIVSEIRRYLL